MTNGNVIEILLQSVEGLFAAFDGIHFSVQFFNDGYRLEGGLHGHQRLATLILEGNRYHKAVVLRIAAVFIG